MDIYYDITDGNLHIKDSYRISKHDMEYCLDFIRYDEPSSKVWNRSIFSLKMEWCVHNFLYSLGLFRSRTKDVDLNYPNKWEWAYILCGVLCWMFVK